MMRLTRDRRPRNATVPRPARPGPPRWPGRVIAVAKERAVIETEVGGCRRAWELGPADVDFTRLIPDMTRWFAPEDRVSGAIVTDTRGRSRYTLLAGRSDPWPSLAAEYPVGTTFTGRVVNTGPRIGAFVTITGGINGRVPAADARQARLAPDTRVEVEVVRVDPAARQVGLALRRVLPGPAAGVR
jgi:small subunit ribosomal protein S1